MSDVSTHRIRRAGRRSVTGRFVGLCVIAGILIAYASAYGGVLKVRGDLSDARSEVARWEQRNRDLRRRLRYLRSAEYVESVARRDLGLVKQGEVLVVLSPEVDSDKHH